MASIIVTAVIAIIALICGFKWLKWYVSTLGMAYYIEKNGYRQPNEDEMKECTQWVIRRLFKLDRNSL